MGRYNKNPFEFNPDDFLNSKIKFGEFYDLTWQQLINCNPDRVIWYIDNVDRLTEAEKKTLIEAIELDDQ